MSRLYRVFSHDPNAAADEPGGVLFIPTQGGGRIDNPDLYAVRYLGDSPAGACAEVFNSGKYRQDWSSEMLRPHPKLPKRRRALAWFDLPDNAPICNLDDPRELTKQRMRPSRVIARDYATTQQWARKLFRQGRWDGVRWWSYHDARWASIGLWRNPKIVGYGIETLTIDHPALHEAADALQIRFKRKSEVR
ncbi:MAG: RES family NAD+ phosphorylase [Vulcanimicrobiaceae bacterium]